MQKPCAPTTRSSLTTGREGDHFCFAKIWFEQETATACPSKRVPYSVQQTGGDNRRGRDKNDCDQVMQHVVSHVTLLGWLWIWKGHPLLPETRLNDPGQAIAHDRTMAEIASFLCRAEDEVRQKAKELGLVEQHIRVVL